MEYSKAGFQKIIPQLALEIKNLTLPNGKPIEIVNVDPKCPRNLVFQSSGNGIQNQLNIDKFLSMLLDASEEAEQKRVTYKENFTNLANSIMQVLERIQKHYMLNLEKTLPLYYDLFEDYSNGLICDAQILKESFFKNFEKFREHQELYTLNNFYNHICEEFQNVSKILGRLCNRFEYELKEDYYRQQFLPDKFMHPEIKMSSGIGYVGRGIVRGVIDKDIFYMIDMNGDVQKVQKLENDGFERILSKKFPISGGTAWSTLAINPIGENLIIGDNGGAKIFLIDLNLEILHTFQPASQSNLNRVMWTNNEVFCAGYNNGSIIFYSTKNNSATMSYKHKGGGYIYSFESTDCEDEVYAGTSNGTLIRCSLSSEKPIWIINFEPAHRINVINRLRNTGLLSISSESEFSILSEVTQSMVFKTTLQNEIYAVNWSPNFKNVIVTTVRPIYLFNWSFENNDLKELQKMAIDDSIYTSLTLWDKNEIFIGDSKGESVSIKFEQKNSFIDEKDTPKKKKIYSNNGRTGINDVIIYQASLFRQFFQDKSKFKYFQKQIVFFLKMKKYNCIEKQSL